jgi:ComF family protein
MRLSNRPAPWKDLAARLARIVLPQDCHLCDVALSDRARPSHVPLLCHACADVLPRIGAHCPICAMPVVTRDTAPDICGQCLRRRPHFDATHAAMEYAFPVDRMVQSLKYAANLPLASTFARLLLDALPSLDQDTVMVAMPLHPGRLRQRGFNQALEIARHVARHGNIELIVDGVRRIRDTPAQAGLHIVQRRANIRRAFACDIDIEGRTVAVVDDVMTTGATLDELARTLKRSGAARVENWVVARTITQGTKHV